MAIAAAFLGLAKNDSSLFSDANDYYETQLDTVFNWDSKNPGVPILLAQISSTSNSRIHDDFGKWQGEAEKYLDGVVNGDGRAEMVGDGLLWYDGDSDSASLNPALNAAMLLMRYAPIATSDSKRDSYIVSQPLFSWNN